MDRIHRTKMLPLLFCVVVLVGKSLALPSANQYIDNVLYSSLQNVIRSEKMDPTFLPDYSFDYYDKSLFIKVHGKVNYTQGALSGLSKAARASECQGPLNSSIGVTINCTLSFNYLQTSYKGQVKYGVLPKVSIDAKASLSTTLVNVGIVKGPADYRPRVQNFGLRQIGQLTTHFTGLGPLNKQMKVLEENYRSRVAAEVTNVILNRFQYALNMAVGQVPMPVH